MTSDTPEERDIVLVVDDSPETLSLLTDALEHSGAMVLVAIDGPSALELVERITPDIVLLDAVMPEMDGFELAREVRKQEGDRQLPIIALTANAMASDRQKCIAVGMDDFLSKPFEPADLTDLLAKWGESESAWSEAS